MSIVQAVYQKVVSDIKKWSSSTENQRVQIYKNAYFILGRPFLESLTQIESNSGQINIKQQSMFIIVQIKKKRQIIFYNKYQKPLQIQCTCQANWTRKIGNKPILACKHEITYLLWKYCFPTEQEKQMGQNIDIAESLMVVLSKAQE